MSDPLEIITVDLAGGSFTGWNSCEIEYSVDQAARTATLTCPAFEGDFPIRPGMECSLSASGEKIITGYVRSVKPHLTPDEHSYTVDIVSRTVDAVEASIVHPTGFVKNMPLDQIAKTFDTCGVGIECQTSFPNEPWSGVNPGASLFYHIEPIARSHSALIYDNPEGKLVLAKEPKNTHGGAIEEGRNMHGGDGELSEEGRFSETIGRAQTSRGTKDDDLHAEKKATDSAVKRYRPKVIVHETEMTPAKLQERVERHKKRAAGYSTSATVTTVGWRADDGKIFQPHWQIALKSPGLLIDQMMCIESVRLIQTIPEGVEEGEPATRAELSLVDPSALNGESASGKSSSAWKGT